MTYQVQVLKGGNWWATHTTTDVNEATNQYFHQIGLHAHAKQPDTSVRLLRQDASGNTTIPPPLRHPRPIPSSSPENHLGMSITEQLEALAQTGILHIEAVGSNYAARHHPNNERGPIHYAIRTTLPDAIQLLHQRVTQKSKSKQSRANSA